MMTPNKERERDETPKPDPSRVEGKKEFSKPMKIAKKKFQMALPDPTNSGIGSGLNVDESYELNNYLSTNKV